MDHPVLPIARAAGASAGDRRIASANRAGRWLFALVVGLVLVTSGPPASAANYTITVDASKQTAGNPRFWSASVGTGVGIISLRADWQTHAKLANRELGMLRVRGHGALSDDKDSMAILKWSGSGAPTYNWTNFDKYLDAIAAANMRPLMELDFMPKDLAKNGDSRDAPKDLNVWKQFMQALVQHCVDKFGADDVGKWYWEVWNEPDYAGFWNGSDRNESLSQKMTEYYALYDATVDGATAVLPNILIGGPSTTEPSKIAAFLQHCKSANKRVNFASAHHYPGACGTSPANATSLLNDNNTRISQITSGGYTTSQVLSFNTEWNSSYCGQGGKAGDANESMDSHANAPFILKAVKLLSDKNMGDTPPVSVFSYWVLTDVFGESGSDTGMYIQQQGGNVPFGAVFGLITFQGMRKAAFNGFKMLNYLGPTRLMSGGGTGGDGVDGLATKSANEDEIQIIVYNYYSTVKTTGSDSVTVNVSNLPATLAGKELFVTQFVVDETHSNPYSVWVGQAKPTNPTEAQWQAMRKAQHLALAQPVSKKTVDTSFSTSFTLNRQGATLITLGLKRPLTGRNSLVEIEAEDYDGQSGASKEDSNDSSLGQSISVTGNGYVYFENVDYTDGGVASVQLRVKSQAAATVELHADSPTGALLGRCMVPSTSNAWASQACTLAQTATGMARLYLVFGGAMHLNWLKFAAGTISPTGAGGAGGGAGGAGGGAAGGMGGGAASGAGGGAAGRGGASGGMNGGTGGAANGGTGGGAGGGVNGGAAGSASGGSASGGSASGGSASGGNSAAGGTTPVTGGGKGSGCACQVGDGRSPSAPLLVIVLVAVAFGLRRQRARG
jgi:xylan 1,4-beta-xylosidase